MNKISHCLACGMFRGGVQLLREGRDYVLGRATDTSIRLPSNKVSRQHAQLQWNPIDEAFELIDLGSRNGVRVNGARLAGTHMLEDGDQFEIGPFDIRYRKFQGSLDALLDDASDEHDETLEMVIDQPTNPHGGIGGDFAGTDLVEFCQFLSFNQKSGMLQVNDGAALELGWILFEGGRIEHAEDTSGSGLDALHRLLALSRGRFEFLHPAPESHRARSAGLRLPTEHILLEITRMRDERKLSD